MHLLLDPPRRAVSRTASTASTDPMFKRERWFSVTATAKYFLAAVNRPLEREVAQPYTPPLVSPIAAAAQDLGFATALTSRYYSLQLLAGTATDQVMPCTPAVRDSGPKVPPRSAACALPMHGIWTVGCCARAVGSKATATWRPKPATCASIKRPDRRDALLKFCRANRTTVPPVLVACWLRHFDRHDASR